MAEYTPGPPVSPSATTNELTRAVWDEFYQISYTLNTTSSSNSPNLDGGIPTSTYGPGQSIDGGGI